MIPIGTRIIYTSDLLGDYGGEVIEYQGEPAYLLRMDHFESDKTFPVITALIEEVEEGDYYADGWYYRTFPNTVVRKEN